ncbi:heme ABC exporter ATP-binding protein CcmA [Curvivirga aplysinae]|uniref:heme ABC exporter ATP-binding protein CcmA n=1 Tax=Curvivirga aplysinae TaxID=2529852 RepID=UPI0012BC655C|nr:heme ABC exporter ATP-binding protein CcmA [Curvivirga aplysinae]MTI08510.1 heme ABC exporter ATP-binding protein CcmA [Curvivirga aplysinae]
MTAFKVHDLACLRGHSLIFSSLSFELRAGEAMVLHGPNGSGKSSLLRVLAGLIPAFSGEMNLGEDYTVEEMMTYIGHANPIKAPLTVRENLTYWAALYGAEEKIPTAMEAMDLTAISDLQGRVLSSGQRRRLTLARLFLEDKPIWLLDEPTVGLDIESCKLLENKIAQHRASDGIVLLSTHVGIDVPDVKQLDMAEFSETQAMLAKQAEAEGLNV